MLSNLEIKRLATRDEQEVAGYAELMDLVFSSWQDIPFTENHIKQLHQILLRYSEKDTWHRGNYKTNSNSVAAFDAHGTQIGIVFQTASPFDTPRLMMELVAWVSQERETARWHPLLIIALCIVAFLEIHPFQDGNGRLSRVLTTLLRLQAGYAYVPYSSLESVVEQTKEAYSLALRQSRALARAAPWRHPARIWAMISAKAAWLGGVNGSASGTEPTTLISRSSLALRTGRCDEHTWLGARARTSSRILAKRDRSLRWAHGESNVAQTVMPRTRSVGARSATSSTADGKMAPKASTEK